MPEDSYPFPPDDGAPMTRGPLAALLWGAFLGCSWTWIIGMVFPALLLRDFGLWGWVAFAVPNVLGAAAMGTVLYKPKWAVDIVRNHHYACHNFTVITVAYHCYVIAWLFSAMFGIATIPMMAIALGVCFAVVSRNRHMASLILAAAVAVISYGCFSWMTQAPGAWDLVTFHPVEPRLKPPALWLFLPASLFGFALCPYLDLTFHRARVNTTGGTGALAFAFGFGVVFCSMIVISMCYGSKLLPFIQGDPKASLDGVWLVLLAVHLTVQAAFTITVHVREALEDDRASKAWLVCAATMAFAMGLVVGLDYLPHNRMRADLSWGEAVYRGILILYGTAFPAYVWMMMIPTLRKLSPWGDEFRMGIYAISCSLLFVFSWRTYISREADMLIYIVGILVVGRIAIELLPKASTREKY